MSPVTVPEQAEPILRLGEIVTRYVQNNQLPLWY
jgi:hypothetical protein